MELRALHRVKMNGRYFLSGEILPEVDEAEAIRLKAMGAAEETTGAVKAAPAAQTVKGMSKAQQKSAEKAQKEAAAKAIEEAKAPETSAVDASAVGGPELPPAKEPEEMTAEELTAELTEMGLVPDASGTQEALAGQLRAALDNQEMF